MSPTSTEGSPSISHVVLTRFNLPTPGPESLVRAKEGWLRSRWELFTRFTVPSVRQQTEQDFHWLIYFDSASPDWLKSEVARHEAEGIYTPLFRELVPLEQVVADIHGTVPSADELITTNLDNDDGLARDFIARLQGHRLKEVRSAIYLSRGLILSGQKVYLRTDRDNAFCSVREPWNSPMTCWRDWHILLRKHMPVTEIAGNPAWLQVIHGTNVSNRVHGLLANSATYRAQFPGLLEGVEQPSRAEVIADRLLHGPLREAKTTLRKGAKHGIMAVGGKETLDTVKTKLAGLRPGPRN